MRFAVLTAALLVSLPAYAGNWNVDTANSKITFEASQSGEKFTGTLPAFTADITFDAADLANAKVSVVMPLMGVSTNSASRDHDLPSPEWFNIAAHPEAKFESSKFTAVDATHFVADGTLTLRGISHPLQLPFTLVTEGNKAVMTGSVSFNRLPFEVGKNWPESSGMSENITVNVAINAVKAE